MPNSKSTNKTVKELAEAVAKSQELTRKLAEVQARVAELTKEIVSRGEEKPRG